MSASALWFTAPRAVEPRPVEVGAPGADEVVVDASFSAISAGTELLLYRDEMPEDLPADETIAAIDGDFSYPRRYGYAVVGHVSELGADVAAEWRDAPVFAFHPHQTRCCVPASELVRIPSDLSLEAAAMLPSIETAVTIVLDAAPRVGERVVIHGAGVIGLCIIDLLSAFPLERLSVVEPRPARRARAEAFGATTTMCEPPADPAYDLSIEVSGDPAALDDAVSAVGYGGRVLVGSWYGTKAATVDFGGRFHRDRVTITSSQVSTIQPALQGRWSPERRVDVAFERLQIMDPTRLITHRIPFEDAEEAYRILDRTPDEALQIILTYQ